MGFVISKFGTNEPLPVELFFPHFLAGLLCVLIDRQFPSLFLSTRCRHFLSIEWTSVYCVGRIDTIQLWQMEIKLVDVMH